MGVSAVKIKFSHAAIFITIVLLGLATIWIKSYVFISDPGDYYTQDPLSSGIITQANIPAKSVDKRQQSRLSINDNKAGNTNAGYEDKQILFGDTHVHTTWSFDAFMFSLPIINASRGSLPPAAACDYARFVSQLDFFFLTDHAESYTSRRWQDAQEAIRHCNAVSGSAQNPDLVAFIGFEWSQFGKTPETHYGHHNVLFRDIESDALPARPIGAAGPASDSLRGSSPSGALGMLRWLDVGNSSYYLSLKTFMDELKDEPACPEGVASTELPQNCYESARTPGALYAKLDEWGLDSLVVPHGSAWGIYTPPGATWDHQLNAANHDPDKARLIEVYSGHGNSENYRQFSARKIDGNGLAICPEPQLNYLPSCWQAGEIIRKRCLQSNQDEQECDARAVLARKNYVDVDHIGGWKSIVGATTEEWLDAGQARDIFLPAFNYRPGKSVQYGLALRNFDDEENPIGYKWGLISSTDTHFARAGNGFKQYPRVGSGDAGMRGTRNGFWDWLVYQRNKEEPLNHSREVVNILGDDSEQERKMSFLTAGGIVAVHSAGRDRGAIWDAMKRREVYGTSGHRMLLWFDMLQQDGGLLPMGSELVTQEEPKFRVTAVGSFKQLPGCPEYIKDVVSEKRLDKLADGECYHPSEERYLIDRIEVVRIRPQVSQYEPIDDLVEDVWRTFKCEPSSLGCTVEFSDKEFSVSGRDAVYYVRAIEEISPTTNGGNLRTTFDEIGSAKSVRPCYGDYRIAADDNCHVSLGHRAWSSPIFVDYGIQP
ncbi:MAG: hypothetical protein ACJAQS_000089 [Porticoccus sp.]|jgi:hypothetical protein